jgi:signal transduction histidine kinase
MAKSKGVQLEAQIDLQGGLIVGDAVRLGQALRNLLGNALKFTAAGGQVSVQLTRQAEFAQITVSDTGEGIDPETLQVIFDRFRQEDGSATRQHGGLGLGLAIVRHLVEAHGGTVKAESAGKGQGATFTVQLPLTTLETLEADMHERRDQASQTDLEPVNSSNLA